MNITDNQETEMFYNSSYVHKGFITDVGLLNDLIKILVGLGIFNRVNFKKLGSDFNRKKLYFSISIPQFISLEMHSEVSAILLREILPLVVILKNK